MHASSDNAVTTINVLSRTSADTSPRTHVFPLNNNLTPVFLYDVDTSERIMSMAENKEGHSRPFLQRVQLIGPSGYPVRATGQVDDGAMRNCISQERWKRYGHCLSELQPTTTKIKVANGAKLTPSGRWFGTVRVGNVGAESWFEVFDSHGAFDVILGKPWLQQVRARHDYESDTLVISQGEVSETVVNEARETQTIGVNREEEETAQITQSEEQTETPPWEQLDREWARIHQIRASDSPWRETRWALHLTVDPTEDEEEEDGLDSWSREFLDHLWEEDEPKTVSGREKRRLEKEHRDEVRRAEGDILLAEAIDEEKRRSTENRAKQEEESTKKNTRTRKKKTGNPEQRRRMLRLQESERRITEIQRKIVYLQTTREEMRQQEERIEDGEEVHTVGNANQEQFEIKRGPNTSQRRIDPFNAERVAEILEKIEIGEDLTEKQREEVENLVREYADIFALTMSEVTYVDWHRHHLSIDPEVKLPKRMAQRPITENQKEWYYKTLDEMEEACVIQKVPAEFIRCLSSTNLVPKEAGKIGATRADVLRKVNAECIKNGLPPFWEEVRKPGETDEAMLEAVEARDGVETKAKWRICHAFMTLNRATHIPHFPQGNINAKHEFAAGHRWASVIDLAAGYYAIPLDDESVPYTAFYVEGRGYYVYLRMPFGLTGAPTTFQELISIALNDMIGRELVSWMDDICLPGDIFEVKLGHLRRFFARCRQRNLSLAPTKTKLFMSKVIFAGVTICEEGIKPNLDKVAAVVNWPEPQDVQDLMAFLGLTGYFRRLINDYARIAAPLTDLTRKVDFNIKTPKTNWKARKGAYKRALESMSLKDKWTDEHQKAFITLKVLLSQEPVLKSPQYDGRRFRVTTDGSAEGFAGWLSQEFETTDKEGKRVSRWHPISYCSKRTSPSESRYEPFLLEFAALKYSMDEFSPYIYGTPVEIETDCQALRDCLLKDKMNAHHSRWMESILAYNIVDIRHRPGIHNPVADGLSRMWTNRKRTDADGSSWSVLPDWEATKGTTRDIMTMAIGSGTPEHALEVMFKGDVFFAPIVRHLLGKTAGESIAERRRVAHRAIGFVIEGGKLWKVSSRATDRVARTECKPAVQGFKLALECHKRMGHFDSDRTKLTLRDTYFWPGMDTDCRQAIIECPQCKNFGPARLSTLLQPIRRVRPFNLIAGDYLKMPKGKYGFTELGVYVDTCSNFVWVSKLKKPSTGQSTVKALERICQDYAIPQTFMSDNGSHFKNEQVKSFCEDRNIKRIRTPEYAPWVNGLVESTNNLLISRLKRLCAPNLDADPEDVEPTAVPYNWPDHLDEAVRCLNDRIIPALNATPREILFGMAFRPDVKDPTTSEPLPSTPADINTHFTLTDSFRYDTHLKSLTEAERKKAAFDAKARVIDFTTGDLIQYFDSEHITSNASVHKLKPRWSPPHIITGKYINSYTLSSLTGTPVAGLYHTRRLRPYIPLRDSTLDLIYPRDTYTYTEEELGIEEMEQRMTDDLEYPEAPQVTSVKSGTD